MHPRPKGVIFFSICFRVLKIVGGKDTHTHTRSPADIHFFNSAWLGSRCPCVSTIEMGTALLGCIPLRIAELAAEGNNLTVCLQEERGLQAGIEKEEKTWNRNLGHPALVR